MWHNRFGPRTPIPGVYLCGASTHPGGSVMAVNGRNAAMAVARDLEAADVMPDHTPVPTAPRVTGTARTPGSSRARRLPNAAMVVVYLAALGVFVGIVGFRGGPSVGDAYGVTKPATAIADGHLHAAAHEAVLPQPPGYALLSVTFRPRLPTAHRIAHVVRRTRAARDARFLPWCAPGQLATHRWYRSQAVLGFLAWLVLVVGAVGSYGRRGRVAGSPKRCS